ncbi:MAG: ABC transporter permease [Imperialibacter sp.]|uniref:ABC transporter permease n=1 Tax=Imperialibacter sp. TaxID=2038411 RepID=UPI003A879ADA
MLRYLAVRLLSAFPALLLGLIGLFVFRLLPSQSVWEERIDLLALEGGSYNAQRILQEKIRIRKELGLDLPVFYLSLQSAALPAALPPGMPDVQKEWVKKICLLTGQSDKALQLVSALQAQSFAAWVVEDDELTWERVRSSVSGNDSAASSEILSLVNELEASSQQWRAYLPAVYWNDSGNQFHLWFSQLLRGDLGVSWKNRERVLDVIGRALSNTIVFTVPAIILIFLSAYWLVIGLSQLGARAKALADQVIYFFDLVPLFGWALLAMILFASGSVFSWFPSHISASSLNGLSFLSRSFWPYVLPVAILWISTLPYITKHIDNAFQKSADLPFVFMARARGLSEHVIKKRYRLRYSLLPAITLFGEYLLAVVSGALVVEVLFSIQGVGMLLTQSVGAQDYPVVTGIILLLTMVRMLSYLITDVLYYWFDPRIRLSNQ